VTANLDTVISALVSFTPTDMSDSAVRLYKILEGFADIPERNCALPAMFGVLERFPDADLGSPGPLVSAIECIPEYESELAASLARKPAFLSVWMAGRILNGSKSPIERVFWLSRLREASARPDTPVALRSTITRSLDKHSGRSNT